MTTFCSFGQDGESEYPKMVVIEGDTVQIYTLEQVRYLTMMNEMYKECEVLLEVEEENVAIKDSIIEDQAEKIENQNKIQNSQDIKYKNKEDQLDICESEKKDQRKEIKRQKRHKWVAIIAGVIVATLGIIF